MAMTADEAAFAAAGVITKNQTRLLASTDDPLWYISKLAELEAPYRIVGSPEVQEASRALGRRLMEAAGNA